jgi:hypothetical protein
MRDVLESLDITLEIHADVKDHNKQAFAELRSALAESRDQILELKAALVEARHEVRELKLIQESMRIANRGESGRDGARGVPGRDGPRGERGPKGERGAKAPVIVAFLPRPERFEVVPVYESGQQGPPIALLSLFQAYDAAVSEIEDRDLTEAAHASREVVEREVAAGGAR